MNCLVTLADACGLVGPCGSVAPASPAAPAAPAAGLVPFVLLRGRGGPPPWGMFAATAAVVVLLVVGWKLLLFFTALLERRPVVFFRPAADPAAVTPTDYVVACNAALYELGFAAGPTCGHAKGGTYRMDFALWLSPARHTAVLVGGGTIIGIPQNRTWLFSRRADGTFVCTVDDFHEPDFSGLFDNQALPGATIHDLLEHHRRRLAGVALAAYSPDVAADLADMYNRRVRRLVELGYGQYVDAGRTVWRYRARGAWRFCREAGKAKPAGPVNYHWRFTKSAPNQGFDVVLPGGRGQGRGHGG